MGIVDLSSRRTWFLLTVVVLLPVLAFGLAGAFARYVADDYCTASQLMQRGIAGAQTFWYLNWTGRFAFTFIIDVLNALGEWTVPLTPAVLLIAWVVAARVAVQSLLGGVLGEGARWWSVLFALLLVGATLAGAPALWQSLYWQTGAVTYLLPIVLATAFGAITLHVRDVGHVNRRTVAWIVLGGALNAIAVACSETAMGLIVGTLVLVLAVTLVLYHAPDRQTLVAALSGGLLGALVSSAIVIAAPGNSLRAALVLRPGLIDATILTLWFPTYAALTFLLHAPGYAALAYAAPFLVARQRGGGQSARTRRMLMVGGYLAVAAAGAPAFYVTRGVPPNRAEIIPVFALVVVIMGCGFLDGLQGARTSPGDARPGVRRAVQLVALVLVAAGPLVTTLGAVAWVPELRAYAAELDTVDHVARSARDDGTQAVIVPQVVEPARVDMAEIGPDPADYPNSCVATYYGLQSIAVAGSR